MPITLGAYIGIPSGDMVVTHPLSGWGDIEDTVPAGGDLNIRHQVYSAANTGDPTILQESWNCAMMPIFSWELLARDFDLTLEIFINSGWSGLPGESWRTFLLKLNSPHTIDNLYIPGAFATLVLHNSSAGATARIRGVIRMRAQ